MANINTLFKSYTIFPESTKIFLVSSKSISWLLSNGDHTIKIPPKILAQKEWCSLVPIGCKCCVTTTGLKWNLIDNFLEFGGIVSTSNTYSNSSEVTILTDNYLLWSMCIDNESQTLLIEDTL